MAYKKKDRPSKRPSGKHKAPRGSKHLPSVCILLITKINDDGELIGQPVKWDEHRQPPHIIVTESGRSRAAMIGDKVLAKMRKVQPHLYHALIIKVLPSEQPRNIVGAFVPTSDGGIIEPVSRKLKESFMVSPKDINDAQSGELVSAITIVGMPSLGMTYAKITDRIGTLDSPRAASLIAAHMHELPQNFSEDALTEAGHASSPTLIDGREDLRDIPLVTIDGADARDFDDAVFAEADGSGFHLIIAIADVAHYVTDDSALDKAALERGNSTYFPDRVIPMLPERLSNGLCSLVPDEDRFCLAVHVWIDGEGNVKHYKFTRGLMRSHQRFTYEDLQKTYDTKSSHPLLKSVIEPLFTAYSALSKERDERGSLDLDLPEYRISFDDEGRVEDIKQYVRLEAHRLIEAFMITANVAAADFLISKHLPGIYRVHETPADERLEDLRNILKTSGYNLQKGALRAMHFNQVLHSSIDKPEQHMIHIAVLRAQMQAYYANENLGHFGLSLQKYCHFTSPIRRYSDLVVHRSLIHALDKAQPKPNKASLAKIALHISDSERKSMLAERDANDRYKVAYMKRHVGKTFSGTITGLNEYGLFITLADNGVTGFVPVRNLSGDFFHYDKKHSRFKGPRTKLEYKVGMQMMIRVQEANTMTSSLIFEPESGQSEQPLRPKKPRKNKKASKTKKARKEKMANKKKG